MAVDLEQILRGNIDKTIHLSLATVKDSKPWVSEVHFAYDDDLNLYFRSLTSRRHSQEIAANPHVAGDIIRQFELGERPLGVYFEGTAELLGPGKAQQKAFECISQRLEADAGILDQAKDPNGHQFYKITVETYYIFAKLDESGVHKHELIWNGGKK